MTHMFQRLLQMLTIVLAAMLFGCGGGSVHTLPGIATFAVGGTVSGLSGTVTLQNNDGDQRTVSNNGPFTFPTALTAGAFYSITVAAQPSSQACLVSRGSGTVSSAVDSVLVVCNDVSVVGQWSWMGGAKQVDAIGQYGTAGSSQPNDIPGAREAPSSWVDANGNFWLFGGFGDDGQGKSGLLDDLWQYSPSANAWTWMGGGDATGGTATYGTQGVAAPANSPGAREAAAAWSDRAGQMWLFGGLAADVQGNQVQLNDLWKYQPASGEWTWESGASSPNAAGSYGMQSVASGSNVPPPRAYAMTWTDSAGMLWLFGGAQYNADGSVSALFDDLWSYNPATGQWTWISGSSTPNAIGGYGTQGSASSGNVPGARAAATAWIDASGNLWLLGGYGLDQQGATGELNDLWRYSPSDNAWTWMGGAPMQGSRGTYGTPALAAAGNTPGARVTATAWSDAAGNFWLFGGYGYDQSGNLDDLNDLWKYSPSSGLWTWMGGSTQAAASGNFGSIGVAAPGNRPGAREQPAAWTDVAGNLWLFGGYGYDAFGQQDDLNDLWRFAP